MEYVALIALGVVIFWLLSVRGNRTRQNKTTNYNNTDAPYYFHNHKNINQINHESNIASNQFADTNNYSNQSEGLEHSHSSFTETDNSSSHPDSTSIDSGGSSDSGGGSSSD